MLPHSVMSSASGSTALSDATTGSCLQFYAHSHILSATKDIPRSDTTLMEVPVVFSPSQTLLHTHLSPKLEQKYCRLRLSPPF